MTKYAITATAALVLGAALGYKLAPTKIATKDIEVLKTDIITKTVTVKEPGGREETTTTVVDKTIKAKEKVVEAAMPEPQYYVRGAYGLLGNNSYDVAIGRRILGNVFVDVGASSTGSFDNKQIKVGLTYLF